MGLGTRGEEGWGDVFDPPYGFSAEEWGAEHLGSSRIRWRLSGGETCRPTSFGEGRRGVIR